MKAPEKLYLRKRNKLPLEVVRDTWYETEPQSLYGSVEYTRTDAFIEKALKWYCLDCECNDNCKYTKCFFYREYERYLNGESNAIPPKFPDRILNEDGSTSDNWRYRHFMAKKQDAFIEKAEEYLYKQLNEGNMECGDIETFIEDFRKHMEE